MSLKMLESKQKVNRFVDVLQDKELKGFEVFTDLFYQENDNVNIRIEIGKVKNSYKEYRDFLYFAKMNFDKPFLLLDEVKDTLKVIIRDEKDQQSILFNLHDISIVYNVESEELCNEKSKTTIVFKIKNKIANVDYRIRIIKKGKNTDE